MGARLIGRARLHRLATRLMQSRVAATTLDDALLRARRLAPLRAAVSFWPDDADPTPLEGYRNCLSRIGTELPDAYLPVKAETLGPDSIVALIAEARAAHRRVVFDATVPEVVSSTLALAAPDVGVTLPARWPRSGEDAETLLARAAPIRILEGSRPDPQSGDTPPKAGLLTLAEQLAGRAASVSVATHDAALAARALAILRGAGTATELELVDGLPRRRLVAMARARGVPVRVTVPYGEAWARYAAARLLRQPWLVLRR